MRWLPCPVNCNGSAGSGNKSAERRDQRTRAEGVTVCSVRHSKSVCAVPFNRASRNRSSLSCRVDVPGNPGWPPFLYCPAALFTRFRSLHIQTSWGDCQKGPTSFLPTVFKLTKFSRGDTKTANWTWRILAVLRFKAPNRGCNRHEKSR